MRVISNRALRSFATLHPEADAPLQAWRRLIEKGRADSFSALQRTFGSVDKVGDRFVFDVGGNKFRLVATIAFDAQLVWIKAVLTHAEYDKERWK